MLVLELPEFIYTTPPITASNTTTPIPIHIPDELDFSSSLPGSNISITSVYSWVIFGVATMPGASKIQRPVRAAVCLIPPCCIQLSAPELNTMSHNDSRPYQQESWRRHRGERTMWARQGDADGELRSKPKNGIVPARVNGCDVKRGQFGMLCLQQRANQTFIDLDFCGWSDPCPLGQSFLFQQVARPGLFQSSPLASVRLN